MTLRTCKAVSLRRAATSYYSAIFFARFRSVVAVDLFNRRPCRSIKHATQNWEVGRFVKLATIGTIVGTCVSVHHFPINRHFPRKNQSRMIADTSLGEQGFNSPRLHLPDFPKLTYYKAGSEIRSAQADHLLIWINRHECFCGVRARQYARVRERNHGDGIPTYDDLIELTKIDHRQGKRW